MRWHSTDDSVEANELSVLACIESLVAMAIAVALAVWQGSVVHIVVGAVITPFLLVKTPKSVEIGARSGRPAFNYMDEADGLGFFVAFFIVPFVFLWARISGTLAVTVTDPKSQLAAIPVNWQRHVLCLDFFRSPEFVPLPEDNQRNRLYWDIGNVYEHYGRISATIGIVFIVIAAAPLFVVPFLYRLSLKSTALVWVPLLWALTALRTPLSPLKARLKLTLTSDVFRLTLLTSFVACVLFICKVTLLMFWNDFVATWNRFAMSAADQIQAASLGDWLAEWPLGRLLAIPVRPGVIPIWQVGMFINSCLCIWLWFFIRSCIRHYDAKTPRPASSVEAVLATSWFFRRLFSSYSIVCLLILYSGEVWTGLRVLQHIGWSELLPPV